MGLKQKFANAIRKNERIRKEDRLSLPTFEEFIMMSSVEKRKSLKGFSKLLKEKLRGEIKELSNKKVELEKQIKDIDIN